MSDNFHSADCMVRHGTNDCTCGYVKPLTKQEKELAELVKHNEYLESVVTGIVKSTGATTATEALIRFSQLRADIGNLLAIIHRDGGHHEVEVGTHQAVEDAIKAYYALRAELDEAREVIEIASQPHFKHISGEIVSRDDQSITVNAAVAFLKAHPERK